VEIGEILQIVLAAVASVVALYFAFREGVRSVGRAIPGPDAFERFDATLEAKADAIFEAIDNAVDTLNPNTNGGPGNPRE
jgi:predicted NBD/HSP70 family sugar kinase